jgi:hypothetical protein
MAARAMAALGYRFVFAACSVDFSPYEASKRDAAAASDPLPSWNDTTEKKAIVDFVRNTRTIGSANFVPPAKRIAVFDDDGTLWLE